LNYENELIIKLIELTNRPENRKHLPLLTLAGPKTGEKSVY